MSKKKKSPLCKSRLGNFGLVDKKRLDKELSQFKAGVKSKEEVEATADVLFERLRRANLRVNNGK